MHPELAPEVVSDKELLAHASAVPLQESTPAAAAADAAEDDPEAELDPEPAPQEASEEELLTQLGLQLEQRIEQLQTAEGVVPPAVAQRWAAEERRRSRERWQPQRPHSAAGADFYEEPGSGRERNSHAPVLYSSLLLPTTIRVKPGVMLQSMMMAVLLRQMRMLMTRAVESRTQTSQAVS